jgi:septum site-determining protein MinC
MSEKTSLIHIKGIRDGILVTLENAPWVDLQSALMTRIESQPGFFNGARMALDVGDQTLLVKDLAGLRNLLSERGVFLWALVSKSSKTEQTAQNLGLATRISKPRPEKNREVLNTEEGEALWIEQTVRSGARIEVPGHVVVAADVNPGAEIAASGNIIVWGRLRGGAHAGAHGDEQAFIAALDLSPAQLRIANVIVMTPKRQGKVQPEVARLKDGAVVIEPWQKSNL